jgi:hypothetical protein
MACRRKPSSNGALASTGPRRVRFSASILSGLNVDVSWFRLEFKGLISGNSFGTGPNDPISRERYTVIPRPDLSIFAPENASFLQLVQDLSDVPQRGGFTFRSGGHSEYQVHPGCRA